MTIQARVLLVDDDPESQASLTAVLEEAGHSVVVAENVDAALDQVEIELPDVVLCDLRLPLRDGFELLMALGESHADLPVIVMSGAGGMDEVLRALRVGAVDYLTKPVESGVLLHAVSRAVERVRLIHQNRDYEMRLENANRKLEDHIRELERDERAGRRVQMGMLPPSPMRIGQYKLCHRIIPSLFLSGDFVDYFAVTERHFCFYIADVSGHGASSAFVTVLRKNFSRRLRREYKLRMLTKPGLILSWVNQELLENHLEKHVTLFIGMLHTRNNMLYFANAGHFPFPMLVRHHETGPNTVTQLEMTGKPLGLFPDLDYDSGSIDLGERSTIVAFTDGVLETMPMESLDDKETRLMEVAAKCGNDPDAIGRELGLHEGLQAPDDIAYVVVSSA